MYSTDSRNSSASGPMLARRCEVIMPIVKSLDASGGGLWQEGIASSERKDVSGEIVQLSKSPPHLLSYLRRCGTVDYNHRANDILGKVEDASFLDGHQIRKSLATLGLTSEVVPPALWVRNKIHALPKDERLISEGQRLVYQMHEAQHPLFMSAYGSGFARGVGTNIAGEQGNLVVPNVFNRVAITPEPVNPDCASSVVIAKSWEQFNQELEEGDHTVRNGVARRPDELPPLVYIAPNVYDSDLAREVQKSLEATGLIPSEGTTGADALKPMGQGGKNNKKHCSHCRLDLHPQARYCHGCGGELTQGVTKSLSEVLDNPLYGLSGKERLDHIFNMLTGHPQNDVGALLN